MTCKTLVGKYAERLENKNENATKYIQNILKWVRLQKDFETEKILLNLLKILDRSDEYEFLEQKNKK